MPSIVRLVCDGCGATHEYRKDRRWDEPDDWKKSFGWVFCPSCWEGHLLAVLDLVESFGRRFTIDSADEDIPGIVTSYVLIDALNDVRLHSNHWGVSIPRREEKWTPD